LDKSSAHKLILLLLMTACTGPMIQGDSNAAMLYTSGAVTVNGARATRPSAVFVGDKIRTADKATASLTATGTTVVIPANSSIVFRGKAIQIASGAVQISTTRNMSAAVDYFSVVPAANGSATYLISKSNGTVTVSAEHGSVMLSDGETSMLVSEGSPQTVADQPRKKRKKGGALIVRGAGTGNAAAGVIVAGALGTVVAITTTGPPASPSRPSR